MVDNLHCYFQNSLKSYLVPQELVVVELVRAVERAEARAAAGLVLNLQAARGNLVVPEVHLLDTVHLRRFRKACLESEAAIAVQVRHPEIVDQASYQAPERGCADLSHEHCTMLCTFSHFVIFSPHSFCIKVRIYESA